MIREILTSPLGAIFLSAVCFVLGSWLQRKVRSPLLNPLLVAVALIILVLQLTGVPPQAFTDATQVIAMLLGPATAVLAVSIYRQIQVLKRHFLPVVLGCLAGVLTSVGSAYLLCSLLGLDRALTASMLPKSVTTAISMELSRQQGGIVAVTVAVTVCTGILGAVLAPLLVRLLRIRHPVAAGVAIGASSHAIGTSKALELGEVEGAMSGVAIGVSGLLTVLIFLFL